MRSRAAWAGVLLLLSGSRLAAGAEPLYNKPVYNPETKSYFELYTPDLEKVKKGGVVYGLDWATAMNMATKRSHHGVRGRLAVVKTKQTHEFLRDTFHTREPTWIGLRYWCRYNKLMWVTGEILQKSEFSTWGPIWNQAAMYPTQPGTSTSYCPKNEKTAFNGVHYWPVHQGFHWNANVKEKYFSMMFVEYPTGEP